MANILFKLGQFFAKHKYKTVIVFLLFMVVILGTVSTKGTSFSNDLKINGLKSVDIMDTVEKEFGQNAEKGNMRIVIQTDKDKQLLDPHMQKEITTVVKDIASIDGVKSATNPYEAKIMNKDLNTTFIDVAFDKNAFNVSQKLIHAVQKESNTLKDSSTKVEYTGNVQISEVAIGGSSELIGLGVALVILVITFKSFITAGLPIIPALIGLASSLGLVSIGSNFIDMSNTTLTLASMIGLAVGIDYALFILYRYRQLLSDNAPQYAIGKAVATAGSAVLFAGVTVIIAVLGLSLVGIEFLTIMGIASAISVLFAMASALILVPAFISIFSKFIKPQRKRHKDRQHAQTFWSKVVVGHPILSIIVALVILIGFSLPVQHMTLGIPDNSMKQKTTTEYKAYQILSKQFGEGFNGPLMLLVETDKNKNQQDLLQFTNDISKMKNVDTVIPPQLSKSQQYALMTIIPEEGPNAASTKSLVNHLRDKEQHYNKQYDINYEVSGQAAINIDMSQKLMDAIPKFAGVIVILAFVLLMIVFRSIIIPFKAVAGFILSLMATLGFTTLIFQDGVMAELFNITSTGPMVAFLPVLAIGILFGLAMDYEVFLMSRIHEEYQKTKDNKHSIEVGLKESGPVIIAAALIMFSVFISFVFSPESVVKSMGLALGFGVLFDAFIVRLTIIPALTKLFGKASWYFPKWLDKILPKFDIEGHDLTEK